MSSTSNIFFLDMSECRSYYKDIVDRFDKTNTPQYSSDEYVYRHDRVLFRDALIRYAILSKYGGAVNDIPVIIGKDSWGKPFCISPATNICFNISHSGRWIVCAVAEQPIGIDVQQIIPLSIHQQKCMSQKILTHSEQMICWESSLIDFNTYLHWRFSMKECCVKAVGLGLRYPFNTISLTGGPNQFIWIDPTGKVFFIRNYSLDSKHTLSVCSLDPSPAEQHLVPPSLLYS